MNNTKKLLCLGLVVLLSGCAIQSNSLSDGADTVDPWEGYNRTVFAFNEGVDKVVLKPASTAYTKVVPSFIRARVTSFFANIQDIPIAANNFLQGNASDGFRDLARVVVNSTIGIAGLFDVASTVDGLEKHDEDFGQTLAVWGAGPGPYVVIPILGPSTVRDLPGRVVDIFINPVTHIEDNDVRDSLLITDGINTRANFIPLEDTVKSVSPDYYVALRDFYLKRRQNLIENNQGDGDDTDDLYQELLSESEWKP